MSFILDALKKSESDRQRQSGPSLFEVKIAPPRRTLPVWAIAIAALLAVNVIVISWMLLRHPAGPQTPAASSAENVPAAPPRHAVAQGSAPPPAAAPASVPGAAASIAKAAPSPAAAAAPQPRASAASSSQPITGAPAAGAADADPADTAPAAEPSAARGSGPAEGASDDLPLYQQVVGSAGLPELHLDLHVFAARPQDRFVMINMHRLGEGDSLPNGVQVEAIRPDGAVLSYHGTRFLLPRS